jgi:hypothetical protein
MKSLDVSWKLGGRYWPGVSLSAIGFNRSVGKESIAQHDARYLGNGIYSYFDNESHTDKPARGVVFSVTEKGHIRTARMINQYINPFGNSSLCTGSFRKTGQEHFVVGWGCSFNGITVFDKVGSPIVTLNFVKSDATKSLFSDSPWVLNGVDWGPSIAFALNYRVIND